jgi:hypothetical protein
MEGRKLHGIGLAFLDGNSTRVAWRLYSLDRFDIEPFLASHTAYRNNGNSRGARLGSLGGKMTLGAAKRALSGLMMALSNNCFNSGVDGGRMDRPLSPTERSDGY